MDILKNILVVVDPTATEHPEVQKAARLAQKTGATIELFACETTSSRQKRYMAYLTREDKAAFVENLHSLVEEIAAPLRSIGLDVLIETALGDPFYAQVLKRAEYANAQLIIKHTHHHSLSRRTFMTNADWQLIRRCPVPLLLTKDMPWASTPLLLAAVDPGHINDKPAPLDSHILDWGQFLEHHLQGSLDILHTYLPPKVKMHASNEAGTPNSKQTIEMIEMELLSQQEQVRSLTAGRNVESSHLLIERGPAGDVIPKLAAQVKADIVIMGAISRSSLQTAFIGSTAERVLENIMCDVLVIKPPDFSDVIPF